MGWFKKKTQSEELPKEYEEFADIYYACKPYTMTLVERMFSLYKSVEYVVKNNIDGDFVECGVWRGGSSLVMLKTLQKFGVTNRKIWLFDTFEGMSEPTAEDTDLNNKHASLHMKEEKKEEGIVWAYASLEDVKQNIATSNYPSNLINYIKGKVEDTIPNNHYFDKCALLRLDTDWYESTKIELEHYYPKLSKNGIMIIDDYGHWQGCKKAVDEYFASQNYFPMLQRIDYTGRLMIKPS